MGAMLLAQSLEKHRAQGALLQKQRSRQTLPGGRTC